MLESVSNFLSPSFQGIVSQKKINRVDGSNNRCHPIERKIKKDGREIEVGSIQ